MEKNSVTNGNAHPIHRPYVAVQTGNVIKLYRVRHVLLPLINGQPMMAMCNPASSGRGTYLRLRRSGVFQNLILSKA